MFRDFRLWLLPILCRATRCLWQWKAVIVVLLNNNRALDQKSDGTIAKRFQDTCKYTQTCTSPSHRFLAIRRPKATSAVMRSLEEITIREPQFPVQTHMTLTFTEKHYTINIPHPYPTTIESHQSFLSIKAPQMRRRPTDPMGSNRHPLNISPSTPNFRSRSHPYVSPLWSLSTRSPWTVSLRCSTKSPSRTTF